MGFKIKKTVNGETVWEPIKAKKYTASKITEYTGSLPITISANGDPLLDYRIYGASGGVGEGVDITGLSEPLCGIQTYTDSLDLSTGILTRRIKKLVLTGKETVQDYSSGSPVKYILNIPVSKAPLSTGSIGLCTHYLNGNAYAINNAFFIDLGNPQWYRKIIIRDNRLVTIDDFKNYLATQYAAGTPVTLWYVLAEPDVSTIPVPPGLTGTIEGYLIQDGTPTPETPIYPITNGVKQSDGTYSIEYDYAYKLPMTVSNGNTVQTVPVYIGDTPLGEDEYVSYSDQKIYKMINGALTPTDPPVPLPEIPTIKGETVIDYDGEPKPSQVYIKYNSWSEWGDIDNYKMVNENWTQEVT